MTKPEPTIKERLDPNSPHYDPEFVKLREAAYKDKLNHRVDLRNGNSKFRSSQ